MLKLLLAEDHTLVRSGIRALLERSFEIRVVGEASDGRQALDLAKSLAPDLAVLDVAMPNLNGIETARTLRKDFPKIRIIMLSMHADPEYVEEALLAGASAYVLKDAAYAELLHAIQTVVAGHRYLSPRVAEFMRGTDAPHRTKTNSRLNTLTDRERQVLQLIGEGHSSPEIAKNLRLSVRTIEAYRQNVMNKLAIHSIAGLTKFAIRHGICSSDPYLPP